jgi:polar amino acid transport system substrate-binding protein
VFKNPVEFYKEPENLNYVRGFDLDIAILLSNYFYDVLGVKPHWVVIESAENRIPFLQEDKVDLVLRSFSITDERKKEIDFSDPYFLNPGLIILCSKDKNYTEYKDLENKKVVVLGKTTAEMFALKYINDVQIIPVENDDFALKFLYENKADAFINDQVICKYYADLSNNKLKITSNSFLDPSSQMDYYGIGVQQDRTELLLFVNRFIKKIQTEGTYGTIYKKWFEYGQGDSFSHFKNKFLRVTLEDGSTFEGVVSADTKDYIGLCNLFNGQNSFFMKRGIRKFEVISAQSR